MLTHIRDLLCPAFITSLQFPFVRRVLNLNKRSSTNLVSWILFLYSYAAASSMMGLYLKFLLLADHEICLKYIFA